MASTIPDFHRMSYKKNQGHLNDALAISHDEFLDDVAMKRRMNVRQVITRYITSSKTDTPNAT